VLDSLRRLFDEGTTPPGATGLIAGFGPGITAEMTVGSWIVEAPHNIEENPTAALAAYLERDFAQTTRR
jgi:1,3,6,8-tetrahydroxynaphthalene synthase